MKLLVDTSVWIDHFHKADAKLAVRLESGQVWTHSVIIGELAAGHLKHRAEILRHLQKLPRANEIELEEGLHFLSSHSLSGSGLSWPDVQVLASARLDNLTVWTRDRALANAADKLGLYVAN